MQNVSTFHVVLGYLTRCLTNIIQGVQFVCLENKVFVIDISEPKQSHKVNEISQTFNHDQNQSHKVNEISQMIIDDSINIHINDVKIKIFKIKQSVSSNFVTLQP